MRTPGAGLRCGGDGEKGRGEGACEEFRAQVRARLNDELPGCCSGRSRSRPPLSVDAAGVMETGKPGSGPVISQQFISRQSGAGASGLRLWSQNRAESFLTTWPAFISPNQISFGNCVLTTLSVWLGA
jgi:hypothetical protein